MFIEEPYKNTKQHLVKERHWYANQLAGGLDNYEKAIIEIKIGNEVRTVETNKAALWLDQLFSILINKNSRRRKIDRWILDSYNTDYLTLVQIKEKLNIKVKRDSDIIFGD